MTSDYNARSRRRFAASKVEPLVIPRFIGPHRKPPEPSPMAVAMHEKYLEKRARELKWLATPDDAPF